MIHDTNPTPADASTTADTILSRLGNRVTPYAALCLRQALDGKADAGETHRIVSELVALIPPDHVRDATKLIPPAPAVQPADDPTFHEVCDWLDWRISKGEAPEYYGFSNRLLLPMLRGFAGRLTALAADNARLTTELSSLARESTARELAQASIEAEVIASRDIVQSLTADLSAATAERDRLAKAAANDADRVRFNRREDYHEDDGPVVWFSFGEDGWPELHFGSEIDCDPPEPRFTRWVKPPHLSAAIHGEVMADQAAALASQSPPAGESEASDEE